MTDMEKIIDRIRKLHAKAESCKSIGSLEEAATFAEAVQKMLSKYKLSMSTLTIEEQDRDDPLGKHYINWDRVDGMKRGKRRQAWVERLAMHVARAHFCQSISVNQSNSVLIIGRESDREVACYVLTILARTCVEQADAAYRKERYAKWKTGRLDEAHGFRESFIFGFVTRIGERYALLRKQEEAVPGMALVFTRSGLEVEKYVAADKGIKAVPGVTMKASHFDAVAMGRAAANRANLTGNGVAAGGQTPPLRRGVQGLIGEGK